MISATATPSRHVNASPRKNTPITTVITSENLSIGMTREASAYCSALNENSHDSPVAPAESCFAIEPDDAADLPRATKALFIGSGGDLVLAYHSDPYSSWYNVQTAQSLRQPLYDLDPGGASTTITARAYGCYCFEPRFVKGGKFFLTVGAVDRDSYQSANYSVRTAFTSYPQSYPVDGGTMSCPAATVDDAGTAVPGCRFTQ